MASNSKPLRFSHIKIRLTGLIGYALILIAAITVSLYFIGQIKQSNSVGLRSYDMGMMLWTPDGEKTPDVIARKAVGFTLDNSEHILVQVPWSPYIGSAIKKAAWMSKIAIEHKRGLTIALDWMDQDRVNLLLIMIVMI